MKKLLTTLLPIILLSCAATEPAHARIARSRAVTYEFQKLHPCPSTSKRYGACPGYIKDHIQALCVGGKDSVDNMQWQTVEEAAIKDKTECKNKSKNYKSIK